jgi:hypothetical protein
MVMFILLNNVTTDAESVHHFVLSTNGPLYTNKCIDSKTPTASVPAPTLITN